MRRRGRVWRGHMMATLENFPPVPNYPEVLQVFFLKEIDPQKAESKGRNIHLFFLYTNRPSNFLASNMWGKTLLRWWESWACSLPQSWIMVTWGAPGIPMGKHLRSHHINVKKWHCKDLYVLKWRFFGWLFFFLIFWYAAGKASKWHACCKSRCGAHLEAARSGHVILGERQARSTGLSRR